MTVLNVLLAVRLKLMTLAAEGNEEGNGGTDAELEKEARDAMATELRKEDARYRGMPRDEYLAGLPKSYACGKCGAVVAIDIEKMMRHDATLPACGCSTANGSATTPSE